MRPRTLSLWLTVLAALALAACAGLSTEDAIATGIAQTLQISQLETAAASSLNTPQPTQPGDQATLPGAGEQATSTLLPTSSVPVVSVSENTNCRSGPRVDYTLVTTIAAGQQVEVVGVFPGSEYVIVVRPGSSSRCWLWLRYASQKDFDGYDLPVATMPPTSTPTNTPSPTYTPSVTPTFTNTPTATP